MFPILKKTLFFHVYEYTIRVQIISKLARPDWRLQSHDHASDGYFPRFNLSSAAENIVKNNLVVFYVVVKK